MSEDSRTGHSHWVRGLLAAGAAVAAARAGEALAVRRWKSQVPPFDPADFEMPGVVHRLTAADGGTVNAMVAGQGPTVILGHGIAGHLGHWAPVSRQLIERGHRVVVFDQRGHGHSLPGSAGFGLVGLAHDLAAVLTELGGDGRMVLGGHSMGGIGIQALARQSPELLDRVGGLLLAATTPKSLENPVTRLLATTTGFRIYRRLLDSETQARVLMRPGFGTRPSIDLIDHLRRSWEQCPDETLQGLSNGLEGFDFTNDLGRLDRSTIVVCGDRDQVTPLAMSRELVDLLPEAELEVATGAGHMIIWERPQLITDSLCRLAAAE